MQLSPGKLWGMRRMADDRGLFKMTAVDQRPPIKGPIARHHGLAEAPWHRHAVFGPDGAQFAPADQSFRHSYSDFG